MPDSLAFREQQHGTDLHTHAVQTDLSEWLSDVDQDTEKAGHKPTIADARPGTEPTIAMVPTKSYDEPPDGGREAWTQACMAHLVSLQDPQSP